MTMPIQISFHGVDRTDTLEDYARRRAQKLEAFGRIQACQVAIEVPHKHKNHGRHYRVRIDLTIPGAEVVVDRCPDEGRAHEDLYAAIDHAFDLAVRRLRDELARRRGTHERVARTPEGGR
jgi:ribosomal subunit interface protein